mmetsp:Transcript_14731/g.24538  ORF Transcript_14731/g.24538 Transcript_14731/m.24538 type:complete len:839 (-) Transcript_14731:178-2694(-)
MPLEDWLQPGDLGDDRTQACSGMPGIRKMAVGGVNKLGTQSGAAEVTSAPASPRGARRTRLSCQAYDCSSHQLSSEKPSELQLQDAPVRPAPATTSRRSGGSGSAGLRRRRSSNRESQIWINLKEARNAAEIVREIAVRQMGWRESSSLAEDCNANIFWYERAISVAEVKLLNECQRVNMIPGMHDMARKASLARALNRMRLIFPDDFSFFPLTWNLPVQLDDFKRHCTLLAEQQRGSHSAHTFIVKPSAGCQGAGIYLVRSPDQLQSHSAAVVQQYVERPLLLDGYKFDFRLYVLVLSLRPLTAYLYREGMARFATNKYSPPDPSNIGDVFMHLTNYSLNKHNAEYMPAGAPAVNLPTGLSTGASAVPPANHVPPAGCSNVPPANSSAGIPVSFPSECSRRGSCCASASSTPPVTPPHSSTLLNSDESDSTDSSSAEAATLGDAERLSGASAGHSAGVDTHASKRALSDVMEQLEREGASPASLAQVWDQIQDIVSKTLLAIHPFISSTYSSCFGSEGATSGNPLPRNCFQVLGFDLILDAHLTPWLLEVNHNPSFTCDTEFDRELKGGVITSTLHLLQLRPFDKQRYKQQLAGFMHARREKTASTPLEKERLQQQRLLQRRAQAMQNAHRKSRPNPASEGEASVTDGCDSLGAVEDFPQSEGSFERALPGEGGKYDQLMIFSSDRLQHVWHTCRGVRGRKLSCTRWQRFLRECELLDERFTQADGDLLFIQVITRTGTAFEDSAMMGYQEFCDALVEIALRRCDDGTQLDEAMRQLMQDLPEAEVARPVFEITASAPADEQPTNDRNGRDRLLRPQRLRSKSDIGFQKTRETLHDS